MQTRPTSIPGLTGLRGVGAIWVVCFHAQYGRHLPIAQSGYLGVDLFFILSGFVLSHAHPVTRWDWTRYRTFLRTRFARIFPMHWAALAFLGLVLVIYPEVRAAMPERFRWLSFTSSIFLVQSWWWGTPAPWNGPAWSLSTEWLVSIAFPLFLIPARRIIRPGLAALSCASCLIAFAVFLFVTNNHVPDVVAPRPAVIKTVCEFAAGCFLYRIYAAGVKINAMTMLAGASLIVTGLTFPALAMLTVLGFPVLILLATQPSNLVTRALSSPVMLYLGEISYSIYLLHWIALRPSNGLQAALGVRGATSLLWFFGYLTLVIALSTLTYRLIEVPGRRMLLGESATFSAIFGGLAPAFHRESSFRPRPGLWPKWPSVN
jgi:peptidoglycan/LPS O-acetylase OafA/YrhL